MKILVTGGLGFIGSAVIRLAINRGHSILNIDSISYAACIKNLDSINKHSNYRFKKIDIRDKELLNSIFEKYQPDSVIHLAAESHVDRSIAKPNDFIETNINGTFNLLEAARKYWELKGKPHSFRFHHVSTDEVFGSLPNDPKIFFTEDSPYMPRSPYSASKASSDHLVRSWFETYGLPTIISNCSNNYGPYQFPEKLIPVVILNALAGKPIPIYGNGKNIRDWLYVEDHALALLLILKNGATGRSYNIGSENECTNLELIKMLCNILSDLKPLNSGKYSDLISFVPDRPGHDTRYAINPYRIRNELGWKPSITLKDGLYKTVRWYLDNKSWWRPLLKRDNLKESNISIKL